MRSKALRGQELIEFLLIVTLITLASVIVFALFGKQIGLFFNNLPSSNPNNLKVTAIDPAHDPEYYVHPNTPPPPPPPPPRTPVGTSTIAGQLVTEYDDGSYSADINGQTVNISSDILDKSNTVFETTGSSGLTDLLEAIVYMINTHKVDYPSSPVPLQLRFGAGTHVSFAGSTYTGESVENIISVIGPDDHAVLLQNDHDCSGGGCNYEGKYRIEWNSGGVSHFDGTGGDALGTTINHNVGWTLNDYVYHGKSDIDGNEHTWNLDFSDDGSSYSI